MEKLNDALLLELEVLANKKKLTKVQKTRWEVLIHDVANELYFSHVHNVDWSFNEIKLLIPVYRMELKMTKDETNIEELQRKINSLIFGYIHSVERQLKSLYYLIKIN